MKVLFSLLIVAGLFLFPIALIADSGTNWYTKLAGAKTDTARVNALNKISYSLAYNKPDSALLLARQALALATKANYLQGRGDANKMLGLYHLYQGNQDSAIFYFRKDLKIKEQLNIPEMLEVAYSNFGNILMNSMDFKGAKEYYNKSIALCRKMKNQDCEKEGEFNLGNLAYYQGQYSTAIKYYQGYLEYFKKKGDENRVAMAGINIGSMLSREGKYAESLSTQMDVWRFASKSGNKRYLQTLANNIGNIYFEFKDHGKSLDYLHQAARMGEEAGDKFSLANTYLNIANVYDDTEHTDSTIIYYQRARNAAEESNRIDAKLISKNNEAFSRLKNGEDPARFEKTFKTVIAEAKAAGLAHVESRAMQNLGYAYSLQGKHKEAILLLEQALQFNLESGDIKERTDLWLELGKLYAATSMPDEAVKYIRMYKDSNDSLFSDGLTKQIGRMEALFQNEKKQFQLEALEKQQVLDKALINQKVKEARLQNIFLSATGIGLFLMMGMAGFAWRSYRQKKKAHMLVTFQKEETERQKYLVEERNLEITDSINYARRLQSSILPSQELIEQILPAHFLLYFPRDIVSGDFYWIHQHKQYIYCAAADCTGHGVPGAIVSMVGFNGLNQSVSEKNILDPEKILDNTSAYIRKSFSGGKTGVRDGMDISLCRYNTQTGELSFSGANNHLWIFRAASGEVEELKANRQPLGYYEHGKEFTAQTTEILPGDTVFLFSDGYADQFGGEKGKKFMSGRLKKLIAESGNEKLYLQGEKLEKSFHQWKGDLQQVDDVLVWGIRFRP